MKHIFSVVVFCALCALIFSGCDDKKIDENIISKGAEMSAEAVEKAKNLDKESYKELADLFLDTSEIDFSREVLIIFGKNQCKYCDMMKDDIKKSPEIQAKIRENFNPYYVNTSYDKIHKFHGFGGESATSSLRGNSNAVESSLRGSGKATTKQSTNRANQKVDCHDFATQNLAMTKEGDCAESRNDNVSAPQDEFAIPTAKFAQIFAVNATPQIVFLDKNGRVKYLFAGYTLKLENMLDDVVANSAPMGDYAQIDKALNELKKDIK